ncbi:hypothetical protein A2118_02585 [Candidatus Kaiserbacteria bacterium GWA2_50_9]|uniref:Uncharacterized protein n=1 Tax=Candidatus Kaiserbacteria bacterium GWA2_50_9 TaxID=1798474 RepID=A0A1F6BSP2_9BACT|nr:MAG: hypothetical protein A2118_02585 [Candidatus Kaiserbacteria bacterium GWA2_50_9]
MIDQTLFTLVQKLQAVCVFAGDIVPTHEPLYTSGWRSGRVSEVDKTGPVFSYERVLAAAALYRMNPKLILVPTGGNTNIPGRTSVPIATVVAFELTQLRVPKGAITEEPHAFFAHEQLVNCAAKVRENGWSADGVAILAPSWQFGRICAMLAHMENVEPFAIGVTHLISMERALAAEDAQWNARFVEWYATLEAREMFAKEALGAGQLWTGHQPRFPNPFRGFPDPLA